MTNLSNVQNASRRLRLKEREETTRLQRQDKIKTIRELVGKLSGLDPNTPVKTVMTMLNQEADRLEKP